jgi:hypothetical protein
VARKPSARKRAHIAGEEQEGRQGLVRERGILANHDPRTVRDWLRIADYKTYP